MAQSVPFAPAASGAAIRFTTDDFPERHRSDMWRQMIARSFHRTEVEPLRGGDLRVQSHVILLPNANIGDVSGRHMRSLRTRAALADNVDDVALLLPVAGLGRHVSPRGERVYGAGEAFAVCEGDLGGHEIAQEAGLRFVKLRRATLAQMAPRFETALYRPLDPGAPALVLLRQYLGLVFGNPPPPGSPLVEAVDAHLRDLVALALGAAGDAAVEARGRGAAAARLAALKADIRRHSAHPDLSPDWLARRHGISPAYLRKLFGAEGASATDVILATRLERALALLAAGDGAISDIAYRVGFGDLSYFNRAFRRRFGATPSQARIDARSRVPS